MSNQTEVTTVCDECEKKRPKRYNHWRSVWGGTKIEKLDFCSTDCIRKYFSPGGNGYEGESKDVGQQFRA